MVKDEISSRYNQTGKKCGDGDPTYLLGIDEIPVLQARLQALHHSSRIPRVCLDPSKTQDAECLSIVQVRLEALTCPVIQLDGVQVRDHGSLPDELVNGEQDGAFLVGAVQLRLGADLDGLRFQCQWLSGLILLPLHRSPSRQETPTS